MGKVSLTVVALLVMAGSVRAAEPLPTMAEIQADLDGAKYTECLQKISRVIGLSGPAAKDYDKYSLLMIKGDALLATRQGPPAIDVYGAAQKAASDKKDAARASALQTLIKKSSSLKYTPKGAKAADAIDITDKKERETALTKLYESELEAAQTRMKALLKAPELPPMIAFAPTLDALGNLELAVGKGTDAAGMKKELADHARESIDKAVGKLSTAVDKIQRSAEELVKRDVKQKDSSGKERIVKKYYKRGITSADRTTLNEAVTTAEKLAPVCRDLKEALDADFKSSLSAAEKVHGNAKEILSTDYSKEVAK